MATTTIPALGGRLRAIAAIQPRWIAGRRAAIVARRILAAAGPFRARSSVQYVTQPVSATDAHAKRHRFRERSTRKTTFRSARKSPARFRRSTSTTTARSNAGQVLARLDPSTFQAQLDQAKACARASPSAGRASRSNCRRRCFGRERRGRKRGRRTSGHRRRPSERREASSGPNSRAKNGIARRRPPGPRLRRADRRSIPIARTPRRSTADVAAAQAAVAQAQAQSRAAAATAQQSGSTAQAQAASSAGRTGGVDSAQPSSRRTS